MTQRLFTSLILFALVISLSAQQQVGINTDSPVRTLDVVGSGHLYARAHSNTINGPTGLELVRGMNNEAARDWRFLNDNGSLKILENEDNFLTYGTEVMRFNANGQIGIGTTAPTSVLHITGGTQLDGGNGYLILGTQAGSRLAFDNQGIVARTNNAPANFYIQSYGGNTHFGSQGGRTFMANGGGYVGIGSPNSDIALNIGDAGFQLYLRNDADDVNDWYIGASNNDWNAGDNQLLFSPSSNSDDATLRLMSITENDGNNAPVMLHTTQDHTLLLDGNEIDTRGTPLYINHNSDQETYINPSGGRVGIGTTSPLATLHLNTSSSTVKHLTLQNDNVKWHLNAASAGDGNLIFFQDDQWFSYIDGVSGQWNSLSDMRAKENILPLHGMLSKVGQVKTYRYSFRHDVAHAMHIGVLAQEVELVFPEIVSQHEGQYGVAYAHLAVIALKAIQEQQQLIRELRDKLDQLRSKPSGLSRPDVHTQVRPGTK